MELEKRKLIIVGASGNMGLLILKQAFMLGHEIAALVGPDDKTNHVHAPDGTMIGCEKINDFDWSLLLNEYVGKTHPIIIDATSENIVKQNWENYYKRTGFPVVYIASRLNMGECSEHETPILPDPEKYYLKFLSVIDKIDSSYNEKIKTGPPANKIYYLNT